LAPQIAGWDGSKLADDLRDLAPCPIVIENEANLALLAEQWLGGAKDSRDVVLVQVGVGIGSALLIGGQIYRGNGGAAGEIAYLTVGSVGDDSPPEGLEGSFEWIAGGNAYRRYGSLAAARGGGEKLARLAGGDPLNVTARTVFDAAAQNDRVALEIVSLLVGRLSRGIADMVTILNPELVLIGGGISGAGELILEPIREAVQRLSPNPPLIALSQLGIEGTALGAVRRSIEIADEQIFFFRTEARKDSLPS
jgi:predicted NBD/HSP70 family sugar kinase